MGNTNLWGMFILGIILGTIVLRILQLSKGNGSNFYVKDYGENEPTELKAPPPPPSEPGLSKEVKYDFLIEYLEEDIKVSEGMLTAENYNFYSLPTELRNAPVCLGFVHGLKRCYQVLIHEKEGVNNGKY